MTRHYPEAGILYPAKAGGYVYVGVRINDACQVLTCDDTNRFRVALHTDHGVRTVAQFWALVAD